MTTIKTPIAQYTLRDDGIVVARSINPGAPRTRAAAAATLDALAGLIEQRRPTLWDQRATPRLEPEVWIELISRIAGMTVALAIVTDEGARGKFVAYSEAIGALLIPTREFVAEEPAIAWLLQFTES
ncbi:MAG: hypothetical protein QNJ81_10705 [Acidimicrobiia bacterium]|nr:hypothetical protein [Acidimicrobiia bacterium]